jgi:polyhydroxybutyrate depolymerase
MTEFSRRLILPLLAALAGLVLSTFTHAADVGCTGEPALCQLAQGTYYIRLPKAAGRPAPAILFLHGYGGEGMDTMRNTGMVDRLLERGYAVIAPDGEPREGQSGRTWDFLPDHPAKRDETAFLTAVADDAAARFGLDRNRMMLAGFSIGGSMTSYVACAAPKAFAAFAPVSGSFWHPHPTSCAGPVRLLHTHGTSDKTVPMEGREVAPGLRQGNVMEAMQIWRKTNLCPAAAAAPAVSRGVFSLSHWTGCAAGSDLELALHEGAHGIPKGWADMTLDWFEGL